MNQPPQPPLHILLIDDDEHDYILISKLLKNSEHLTCRLDWTTRFEDALSSLQEARHNLYLFDYYLGPKTGMDLLKAARALTIHAPIIMLTGNQSRETGVMAIKEGAADYLLKSDLSVALLERSIRYAMERTESIRKLLVSERRYRETLNSIEDAYWEIDIAGNFTYVNGAASAMSGYHKEEMIGMNHRDYTDHETAKHLEHIFKHVYRTGIPVKGHEYEMICKDGTRKWIEASISLMRDDKETPIGFRGISRDLTERKKNEAKRLALERQMQQNQKLKSLGMLAGGIAHDFNNLLTAIMGHATLAQMKIDEDSTARKSIEQIQTATQQAADLINQLLAYSGKGRFHIETIDLNALVQEMTDLLKVSIQKNAVLDIALTEGLPPIEVDTSQVRQVIMNLITNASDALDEQGGTISIRTGTCTPDEDFLQDAQIKDNIKHDTYVTLVVRDTGCGMPAHTLQKLFEPFYTTKDKGRGLGMAAVLGIMRSHEGTIKVDSMPGSGTTFQILFPCAGGSATKHCMPSPQSSRPTQTRESGGMA